MPTKKDKVIKKKITIVVEPEPKKVDGRSLTALPRGRGFAKGNKYAFKPGQSGNPAGRAICKPDPIKQKISRAYKARLGEMCDLPGCEGMTWAEAIAKGIIVVAAGGDVQAAREVRESTEGKIPETVRIGNEDDKAFQTEVTNIDARLRQLLGLRAGTSDSSDESGGES